MAMRRPPIPRHAGDVTARWIQEALAAGGGVDLPSVREIALEDIGAGIGYMGTILRCTLRYEEPRTPAGQNSTAPETLIVKLPSRHAKNRRLGRWLGLHKREYNYYRLVAPAGPLRSPALYYGDIEDRTDRVVLLLEDMEHMETVSHFDGASAEQARQAIRAIAKLHATYWNRVDRPPANEFPDSFAPKRRRLVQLIYLANLTPALAKFGDFFSDDMRRLAETLVGGISAQIERVGVGPRTLSHGDFRLNNMFFGGEDGGGIGVIDWQISGVRSPLYDVAYFMGSSVRTEVRREIEREVVEEYTGMVGEMGVRGFTFEESWRLYREQTLANLLVMVLASGGLDLEDERGKQAVEVGLQRGLAMVEDLDGAACVPVPGNLLSGGAFAALTRLAYGLMKVLRR